MALIRIGISGWRYVPWRKVFYPDGLPQTQELRYASNQFSTIELNGSFYSLQRPAYFRAWKAETPPGFVFSVKGPRFITHILRLRDCRTPLATFFGSGVLSLGEQLGPFLWQLPPSLKFDEGLIDEFLSLLPRTAEAAVALARDHDPRFVDRMDFQATGVAPLRHAMEVRHDSFLTPRFIECLRRHQVAAVVADTAGKWPVIEDVTSEFMYLRLHGDKELYASGYSDEALKRWARKISAWSEGDEPADGHRVMGPLESKAPPRDVFCYFDNDVKVHAPADARSLKQRLGLPMAPA